MFETISVRRHLGEPSKVLIGNILPQLDDFLPSGRRVVVITDRNLARAYPELIGRFEHIIIGLGEGNKTLTTVERAYSNLLKMNADREIFILGVGGGIVTDTAGYVASTWLRGVRFGFVATSLLAQVDASVGGKNGVNLHRFKNMVGTFNQPDFVLCDTGMLATLPEREFRAGLAEIAKAGIIADPELFSMLEAHTYEDLCGDQQLLGEVIARAVRVKANIVEQDEREAGERRKLNLGHTFAHAIEKLSHRYVHGEAVAIGTAIIADLSERVVGLQPETSKRIVAVLDKMGLPVSYPSVVKLIPAVHSDKKRDSEAINLILIRDIGNCEVRRMPLAEIESYF